MTLYRHLATAVLALVTLAACAPQKGPGASEVMIYGGTAVTDSTWQSAVAIVIQTNASQESLCSGTLVTPQLVITAAHCLVEDGSAANVAAMPTPNAFSVFFGNSVTGGQKVGVSKVNWNPAYNNTALNDVAYVILSQPVANVQIIEPTTSTTEETTLTTVGAAATVVGFGETESNTVGQKYQMTSAVGQPDNGALFIGGNGKDSCQGDSGGPAFGQVNGQWRLFGVTSRGVGCGNGGDYARLYDSLCWVEQDSGQKIPNSQLPCDAGSSSAAAAVAGTSTSSGVASAVSTSSGIGNDLSAFLAPSSLDPTQAIFEFDIGTPLNVASVTMCFGTLQTCLQSQQAGLAAVKTTGPSASRNYFETAHPVKLTTAATITLLGYDANNNLIEARAFSFVKSGT